MPVGRPAEYDYELCKEICEKIALGGNIIEVLDSEERYPSWPSFRRWKNQHDELSTLYINAIQDKSEAVIFEIDQICKDLRNGLLEPSVANVLIQTLKWKAAKFYPKMFGDKSAVDITTKGESLNTLTAEQARKKADELDNDY